MKKDNPSNTTYSSTLAFLYHRYIQLSRTWIIWFAVTWISYLYMDILLTAKQHQMKTNMITQVTPLIAGHLPFFGTNLFLLP